MDKEIISPEISESPLVGERIKQVRKLNKMTQKSFAESLGIVQGFLCAIERGKKYPSDTLLIAMQHLYDIDPEWLHSGNGRVNRKKPIIPAPADGSLPWTPLLKNPLTAPLDVSLPSKTDAYISMPGVPENCFAIEYSGDYMSPTIRDGDIVIIMPGETPVPGKIALIMGQWGEPFLRRYRSREGEIFYTADNSSYTPFKPDPATQILGIVKAVWRKIKL